MADKTVDDDLDLKPADAGAMFRAEMFATNFFLGYWKHIVAVLVVILLTVLMWGQYRDYVRRTQRSTTARIAQTMGKLPTSVPMLSEQLAAGEVLDSAALLAVADELVAIGNGASRTARVEAMMTAAELFRLAGQPQQQRGALEIAAAEGKGILGYAARGGLANLELMSGEGDAAIARLQALVDNNDGFLAEQAAIDLGLALEHLDRRVDASKVYGDFLGRFPESPRTKLVEERKKRVDSPPVPVDAPAPVPVEAPGQEAPGQEAPGQEAPGQEAPGQEAPAPDGAG